MFIINPFFNQRRSKGKVQKEHRAKTMQVSNWNTIGSEIQQSIQALLTKHGINHPH